MYIWFLKLSVELVWRKRMMKIENKKKNVENFQTTNNTCINWKFLPFNNVDLCFSKWYFLISFFVFSHQLTYDIHRQPLPMHKANKKLTPEKVKKWLNTKNCWWWNIAFSIFHFVLNFHCFFPRIQIRLVSCFFWNVTHKSDERTAQ